MSSRPSFHISTPAPDPSTLPPAPDPVAAPGPAPASASASVSKGGLGNYSSSNGSSGALPTLTLPTVGLGSVGDDGEDWASSFISALSGAGKRNSALASERNRKKSARTSRRSSKTMALSPLLRPTDVARLSAGSSGSAGPAAHRRSNGRRRSSAGGSPYSHRASFLLDPATAAALRYEDDDSFSLPRGSFDLSASASATSPSSPTPSSPTPSSISLGSTLRLTARESRGPVQLQPALRRERELESARAPMPPSAARLASKYTVPRSSTDGDLAAGHPSRRDDGAEGSALGMTGSTSLPPLRASGDARGASAPRAEKVAPLRRVEDALPNHASINTAFSDTHSLPVSKVSTADRSSDIGLVGEEGEEEDGTDQDGAGTEGEDSETRHATPVALSDGVVMRDLAASLPSTSAARPKAPHSLYAFSEADSASAIATTASRDSFLTNRSGGGGAPSMVMLPTSASAASTAETSAAQLDDVTSGVVGLGIGVTSSPANSPLISSQSSAQHRRSGSVASSLQGGAAGPSGETGFPGGRSSASLALSASSYSSLALDAAFSPTLAAGVWPCAPECPVRRPSAVHSSLQASIGFPNSTRDMIDKPVGELVGTGGPNPTPMASGERKPQPTQDPAYLCVAASENGWLFAAGTELHGFDAIIDIWDIRWLAAPLFPYSESHSDDISSLAFYPSSSSSHPGGSGTSTADRSALLLSGATDGLLSGSPSSTRPSSARDEENAVVRVQNVGASLARVGWGGIDPVAAAEARRQRQEGDASMDVSADEDDEAARALAACTPTGLGGVWGVTDMQTLSVFDADSASARARPEAWELGAFFPSGGRAHTDIVRCVEYDGS
ncbi:hypothetical protein OC834_006346, partial [Tilletia horrida]